MADVIARVTLAEQIAEVQREMKMRKSVYDRLHKNGTLSMSEITERMTRLAAVLRTLEQVRDSQNAKVGLDVPRQGN